MDLDLIKKAQAGDMDAFAKLYDANIKKIYNFIYYKTWHKESAEDLTSQTFLKVLDKIKSFNTDKGNFSAWVYQIAKNTVTDYFRSFKTHSDIDDAWNISDNIDIVSDIDTKLKLEKVKAGLSSLTTEQREIVILRLWEGMSHTEIAEIMGKNEASVKMSYSRAVSKLRKEIVLLMLLIPYIKI